MTSAGPALQGGVVVAAASPAAEVIAGLITTFGAPVVVGTVICAIIVGGIVVMSQKADDSAGDAATGPASDCPNKPAGDEGGRKDSGKESGKDYPENPDDLEGEGYKEISNPKAEEKGIRRFRNPETGDEVEFHKGKPGEPGWRGKDHYHRINPESTGSQDLYLDKYGNPVPKGSGPSHLEPRRS